MSKRLIIGISGASGAVYGVRALEMFVMNLVCLVNEKPLGDRSEERRVGKEC